MRSSRIRVAGAMLAGALSLLCACADSGGTSCGGDVPAFDISGTYTERYKCSEGQTCVDNDATATITISGNSLTGEYTFSDGDWSGSGLLCGTTFAWDASDPEYTESGVWTFSDKEHFVKTSDYTYKAGGGKGSCTGAASQVGAPPAPAAIGACP